MRDDGRRQLFVKFGFCAERLFLYKIGSLGVGLTYLRYLIPYLLLEELFVKFVSRALKTFLFFAELLDHLDVMLTNIHSLLPNLSMILLFGHLLSSDLFIIRIIILSLEGARRFGIMVEEFRVSIEDEGSELERTAKVIQSQRGNDAFRAETLF